MSLQYGLNITASNMKKILEENDKQQNGIRSWRQLFGNASLDYAAQSGALKSDYASAMNEAYKANLANRDAIMRAGYNTGATKEMIGATRNDLTAAYDTYIRNFSKDQSTLATNYQNEQSALDADLTARAENFAKIYSSAYDYLSKELYGSTFTRDGEEVDVLKDQGLDWLYLKDETGNPTEEIMSWDNLSRQLFNEDGSLNRTGIRFYDQMFNTAKQDWITSEGNAVRSFDQWLSDTYSDDKDWGHLRDWWLSQDIHNYNLAGTNKGTGQNIIGLDSRDQLYTPGKYTTFKDIPLVNNFSKTLTSVSSTINDAISKYSDATYEISKSANRKDYDATSHRRRAQEQRDKAISSALNELKTEFDSIDANIKSTIGSERYQKFYTENKTLYDKISKSFSDLTFSNSSAELKNIESSWTELLKRLKEYATYSHSKSGF